MNKKTFQTGESVSPEFLNAIQNPSFEKEQDEVGHLPLPPDYENRNQWKTFETEGDNKTCSLGSWTKNAVIRAKASYDGSTTVFPEHVNVESVEMAGLIVFVPYLTTNKTCTVTYTVSGRSASAVLVQGEIAVLYTETFDFAVPKIKKILSTSKCNVEELSVSTKLIFKLASDRSIVLEASYDNNKKVLSLDANEVNFGGSVKASEIHVGDSSSGEVVITKNGDNSSILIKAKGQFGPEQFQYNSDTGVLSVGSSYQGISNEVIIKKGMAEFIRDASGYGNEILINKDVSNTGDVIDSPGAFTIYSTNTSQAGTESRKTVITAYGISSYTHNGSVWVEN